LSSFILLYRKERYVIWYYDKRRIIFRIRHNLCR